MRIFVLMLFFIFFIKAAYSQNYDSLIIQVEIKSTKLFLTLQNNSNKPLKVFMPKYLNELFLFINIRDSVDRDLVSYFPDFNWEYSKVLKKKRNHFIIKKNHRKNVPLRLRFKQLNAVPVDTVDYYIFFSYEFPYDYQKSDSEIVSLIKKSDLHTSSYIESNSIQLNGKLLKKIFNQIKKK